MNGYYKCLLWLDKKYNSLALIGRELLSCISCPIRARVCNCRLLVVEDVDVMVKLAVRPGGLFEALNAGVEANTHGNSWTSLPTVMHNLIERKFHGLVI